MPLLDVVEEVFAAVADCVVLVAVKSYLQVAGLRDRLASREGRAVVDVFRCLRLAAPLPPCSELPVGSKLLYGELLGRCERELCGGWRVGCGELSTGWGRLEEAVGVGVPGGGREWYSWGR